MALLFCSKIPTSNFGPPPPLPVPVDAEFPRAYLSRVTRLGPSRLPRQNDFPSRKTLIFATPTHLFIRTARRIIRRRSIKTNSYTSRAHCPTRYEIQTARSAIICIILYTPCPTHRRASFHPRPNTGVRPEIIVFRVKLHILCYIIII